MRSEETIQWLESFYSSYCDGDWEHESRVRISTIDNPGWSFSINLQGTPFEKALFVKKKNDNSESDWVHCWLEDGLWEGRGGSRNLGEILEEFRSWVESTPAAETHV
jgi:hypothetical protein